MKITKGDFFFSASLLLAIWFGFIGMVWAYWIALVAGYPAGLLSLGLWYYGKQNDERTKRYKVIPILLIIGLVLSLGMLIYILLFE